MMSYTKIATIFADSEALSGQTVTVGGWVRTIRDLKGFGFIELNDGSCFRNLQIVMEAGALDHYKDIAAQNVGAALIVTGVVALTPDAKQPLELKATEIAVEGTSSPDYPLQKKRHSVEFLRTIQHLRPRTNLFSATFRVRSVAAYAIHEFFQSRGFVYVQAAIITGAAAEANIANVMPTILVCQTLVTIVSSLVFWFIFKGHKVKQPLNPIERGTLEKFNAKQIISLLSIVLMLVLLIFVKVNIGVAAFAVAGLLFLFGVADDGKALKSLPWGTIVMVLSVGALMNIVDTAGGIDLLSNALSSIMTPFTATPFMGISAGLLSMVSSALGVVYPTMMPMSVDIAAEVGGNVNPVALMAAVGAGGSLSGVSPLSTGGALILAALGTAKKDFTGPEERKTFLQLFVMAGVGLLVIVVVSILLYNPIANLLYQA